MRTDRRTNIKQIQARDAIISTALRQMTEHGGKTLQKKLHFKSSCMLRNVPISRIYTNLDSTMSRFRQRKLRSCGNLLDHVYRILHPACQAATTFSLRLYGS